MLRALADDLTGALEVAACFAGHKPLLPVQWSTPPRTSAFVFDTETREATEDAAIARVTKAAAWLSGAAVDAPFLAFKKLDSMLRGHVAAEIAACMRGGGFVSAIIAPALPAQARVTRDGRQHQRTPAGGWERVGADLIAQLARIGIAASPFRRGKLPRGSGVFLCDAETQDDLRHLTAAARHVEPPVLWCGAAGLALAHGARPPPRPQRTGVLLAVVGSDHPVAAAQVARLPAAMITLATDTACAARVADAVAARLCRGRSACLVFRPQGLARSEAAAVMYAVLRAVVAAACPPDMLLVIGGDTAFRLCGAAGVDDLRVLGEVAGGTPISRIVGGAYDGRCLITRSGSFGSAHALAGLIGALCGDCVT